MKEDSLIRQEKEASETNQQKLSKLNRVLEFFIRICMAAENEVTSAVVNAKLAQEFIRLSDQIFQNMEAVDEHYQNYFLLNLKLLNKIITSGENTDERQ